MTDDRPVSLTEAPIGYADWLDELRSRIHTARQCRPIDEVSSLFDDNRSAWAPFRLYRRKGIIFKTV